MTISTRTDVLKYSFFPRTVIDWNHLDEDTVSAPTVLSFKERLRNHRHWLLSWSLYPFSINAWIRLCWSIRAEVEVEKATDWKDALDKSLCHRRTDQILRQSRVHRHPLFPTLQWIWRWLAVVQFGQVRYSGTCSF